MKLRENSLHICLHLKILFSSGCVGGAASSGALGSQGVGSVASLGAGPGSVAGDVGSLLGGAEVGEEEGGHGFVLGRAQDHARPASNHDTNR